MESGSMPQDGALEHLQPVFYLGSLFQKNKNPLDVSVRCTQMVKFEKLITIGCILNLRPTTVIRERAKWSSKVSKGTHRDSVRLQRLPYLRTLQARN